MKYEPSEKYKDIEEYLCQHKHTKVTDLTKRFFISEATVRRILAALEQKGLIRRYHGGVTLVDPEALSSIRQRSMIYRAEKTAIGALAASFVSDGMTLLMMGGSTVDAMCPFIKNKRLTIITNSLPVVSSLAWENHIQVILLGGVLNSTEMETRGTLTEHNLSRVHADIMFLGASGIHPAYGIMTDDPNSVGTYLRCASVSNHMYVLADNSKFVHFSGTTSIYNVREIKHIVTDSGISPSAVKTFSDLGVALHIAQPDKAPEPKS